MKPYMDPAHQPNQGPAPITAQHYAELHLDDIVGLTDQPATADATCTSRSAPATAGAAQQVPPHDPRRAGTPDPSVPPPSAGSMRQGPTHDPRRRSTPDAAIPPALAVSMQHRPPQDPRMSSTPDAAVPPTVAGSMQQAALHDLRQGHTQQASNAGLPHASVAPPAKQPADTCTTSVAHALPKDPQEDGGGLQYVQRTQTDPRQEQSLAMPIGKRLPGILQAADELASSSAQAHASSRRSVQVSSHDLDEDDALLYSSELTPIISATQAKGRALSSASREATPDAPEEQLLYDDPSLLLEEDYNSAPPRKRAMLNADGGTAEMAIPGLDESHPTFSAARHSSCVFSRGAQSNSRSQQPSKARQQGVRVGRHQFVPTGAETLPSDQCHPHSSAGSMHTASTEELSDMTVSGVGRRRVDQVEQRPGLQKPITLPPPGRPGSTQGVQNSVPKPITLQPPAAARRGAGGFKAHSMDYKR